MQGHPILSVFKQTEHQNVPLLLAVGRELNGITGMINQIGPYDFRQYPRCGFWNTSYGMVARVKGIRTWQLKQHCVRVRGSPIVYTDALPQCVPNAVVDKLPGRENIEQDDIKQHIDAIFSHTHLVRRVRLVVLSGLDHRVFARSRSCIAEHCSRLGLPCIRVPFFHGMNTRKIQQALSTQDRQIILEIVDSFLDPAQ